MVLKYVSKFASDILPSVVATIIGAYIVNHYIVTKPGAEAPIAASASVAEPKKSERRGEQPAELSSDVANIPESGVKAKGISEKAVFEKSPIAKFLEGQPVDKSAADKAAADKSAADKPAETASLPSTSVPAAAAPVEMRQHVPEKIAPEKTAIRVIPLTAQPGAPAAATVPPAVEASVAPEEHRDANDLARAAIERLRTSEPAPRQQNAARTPDTARVQDTPRIATAPVTVSAPVVSTPVVSSAAPSNSAMRPLPPPIVVSTPSAEASQQPGFPQSRPSYSTPYPASARMDDPRRPIPPADIPNAGPDMASASRPLDLRAEATPPTRDHTSVGEDMLLAAKSVFHAVLPQQP